MGSPYEQSDFATPTEIREFPNGTLDVLRIGGGEVGRLTLQPGWRWSNDVKPVAGTDWCEAPHFQYHVSGTLRVHTREGQEFDATPGQVTACRPDTTRGWSATSRSSSSTGAARPTMPSRTSDDSWSSRTPCSQDAVSRMTGAAPRSDAAAALAAVERFSAAVDARDVDAVMAAMTPDCIFEDTTPPDGRRHVGAPAVRAAWAGLFAASPDAEFHTEETFAAGDRVITRWRYDFTGGHVRGVDIFTVRDGHVAEKLSYVKG